MPYIKKDDRVRYNQIISELQELTEPGIRTPGELNYLVTQLCIDYLVLHGKSYQTINDIAGALEGAKLEFYRRVAAPYEDKKVQENGDVY